MEVKIESSWKHLLKEEFSKPYFEQVVTHLKTEKLTGKEIYPPGPMLFNAFNNTPIDRVKVVILGQDPYHGHGQAMGLSFSVPVGVKAPPSLANIYKELKDDIGLAIPNHGDLTAWTQQGVLLLNASLTVRANEANSHAGIGWHFFTDAVIQKISAEKTALVFMLWGKFAQEKERLIDGRKHLILKAAHPSPLSAYAGFFGCKHFSKANQWLMQKGYDPVDWHLK